MCRAGDNSYFSQVFHISIPFRVESARPIRYDKKSPVAQGHTGDHRGGSYELVSRRLLDYLLGFMLLPFRMILPANHYIHQNAQN